jgi:hypothetical protein
MRNHALEKLIWVGSASLSVRLKRSVMKISVVMPVYNERAALRQVVERVLAVPWRSNCYAWTMEPMTAHAKSFPSCRLNIRGFAFASA